MFLTIRTDKPEAEVGLYDEDAQQLEYEVWHAHRELSVTLLSKLKDVLGRRGIPLEAYDQSAEELTGIVVYKGPGSFTGLRIGLMVANTLSASMNVPIVGASGERWQADGVSRCRAHENEQMVMPEYGAEANITKPRK